MDLFKESKKYELSGDEVLNELKELKTLSNDIEISQHKNRIVMANICLVGKVMKPYLKMKNVSSDDLLSEGIVGIYTAIDKFDTTKNVRFSTYAFFWIKQKIQRFVENNYMNGIDRHSVSIDEPVFSSEDSKTLGDTIKDDDSLVEIESLALSDSFSSILDKFTDRERFILRARYGI